jgi:Uma2 family endonuclease
MTTIISETLTEPIVLPVTTADLSRLEEKEIGLLVKEALNNSENRLQFIDEDKQIEFVDGREELKEMSGMRAAGLATRIAVEIGIYLKTNQIGRVYGADAMFTFGENDRMPDVSFVAAERIPAGGEPYSKADFAPDLAVEVVSPNDIYDKVFEKIEEYFATGVKQVWLVEPRFDRLKVYRSLDEATVCTKTTF